jgi:hypothetical protein
MTDFLKERTEIMVHSIGTKRTQDSLQFLLNESMISASISGAQFQFSGRSGQVINK